MKKLTYIFSAVCLTLVLVSCSQNNAQDEEGMVLDSSTEIQNQDADATNSSYTKNEEQPFEGKIAIISFSQSSGGGTYESAQMMAEKYGIDQVDHIIWPVGIMSDLERVQSIISELGADPNVKVIIAEAVMGLNEAVLNLKETRDDIFVIYIEPEYYWPNSTQEADIILSLDILGMGPAMVQQAHKMGAEAFVHYSVDYNMNHPVVRARRDLIQAECNQIGIKFIDAKALDPSDVGVVEAGEFILEDVPRKVEECGKDTAFFTPNGSLYYELIKAVIATGAIYPQPNDPNPYAFILALGLEQDIHTNDKQELPVQDIFEKIRVAVAEKNMQGRLSTWPERSSTLLINASTDYAIKWINDEVPQEDVDVDVLKQLMMDYAGVEVYLTPYTDAPPYTEEGTGETYNNFLLMRMDYITF